jgi:hypothetical protein
MTTKEQKREALRIRKEQKKERIKKLLKTLIKPQRKWSETS